MSKERTMISRAVVVQNEKRAGVADLLFNVFLCPHCSGTHVEITLGKVGPKFCFVWDPKDAEALADMLVNPSPVPMEDLI